MTDPSHWLDVVPDVGVACPRRGQIVDLERCLTCNWLLDLDRTRAQPSLLCMSANVVPDGRRTGRGRAHVD